MYLSIYRSLYFPIWLSISPLHCLSSLCHFLQPLAAKMRKVQACSFEHVTHYFRPVQQMMQKCWMLRFGVLESLILPTCYADKFLVILAMRHVWVCRVVLAVAPCRQRIPRYRLLLETILQYTSIESKMHSAVEESLSTMGGIASKINSDLSLKLKRNKVSHMSSISSIAVSGKGVRGS